MRKPWHIAGRSRLQSAAASSQSWYQGQRPAPGPAARTSCHRAAWTWGQPWHWVPGGQLATELQDCRNPVPGFLALWQRFALESQQCQSSLGSSQLVGVYRSSGSN